MHANSLIIVPLRAQIFYALKKCLSESPLCEHYARYQNIVFGESSHTRRLGKKHAARRLCALQSLGRIFVGDFQHLNYQ